MINPSRKIFYLIFGADVLLLIVAGLLVWQIKEERTKLTEATARSSLIQPSGEELLSGSWPKLESQLAVLDGHFLSASTTVEFLERLENAAKLTKTVFKINQINQAEAKNNLSLNFSVQGSFSAVNQFLTLLEKFPYALRLERLDLRAEDKGSWRGDFVITIMTQKD